MTLPAWQARKADACLSAPFVEVLGMGGRFIKDTNIMLKKGRDETCMEVVVAVVEVSC